MGKIGDTGTPYTIQSRDCHIMGDARFHRLLEIGDQIDALRREQDQIVQSLLPNAEPALLFDDHRRRIYWDHGSVKLGKKSYSFVKTLWHGKDRQADLAELEENVWMQRPEMETFVDLCTVSMLVRHIQKNLHEANFPYEIESVKHISNRELMGFRLAYCTIRKKS